MNSFNLLNTPVQQIFPAFVTMFGLFVIAVLIKKNVKASILWGILSGVFLYYLIAWLLPDFHISINVETFNPVVSLKEFFDYSLGKVFVSGWDFSKYISEHGIAHFLLTFTTTTIAFCLVNIFDTSDNS